MKKLICSVIVFAVMIVSSCSPGKGEEYDLAEIERDGPAGLNEILAKTESKPWRGEEFKDGVLGGTWNSSVTSEPKSFNLLVAERDAETQAIVANMYEYLLDYDVIKREWKPLCASAEIQVDEEQGTLDIIYTLRENLYWTFYQSDEKIPVTSDDVVFWYNEIEGDPVFNSSTYNSHFLTMEDGSEAHIDIRRIDDRRFAFHFPRIVADPLLAANRDFGPAFIYKKAKDERGAEGVLDLFSVAADVKTIPSMGKWYLVEYVPGQRLVYKRNPHYWDKDSKGVSMPYIEENVVRILSDKNTEYLVFKEGSLESYIPRPEDLDELVSRAGPQTETAGYTVFNAEGSIAAPLWSFNQNPKNENAPWYRWFTLKEFRQAMSCLLNRDRIGAQVYRGLAEPKVDFFPPPNPYYNPDIRLEYLYDPERALRILESIGFTRDAEGVMRDANGTAVEFDLSISSDVVTTADMASIIADEAGKIGIKINIRTLDFQKLVEQLTSTYDWSSIIIGLGSNFFPTQGSNVWPSTGNLHLWHPLQKKPATDWEARIDYLYNEGSYTIDKERAREIWDEYQRLILEQCPIIYLMRQRSFFALRNRWDFTNFYYDNLNSVETRHIFLREE
ncbi:MAG: ABC transporter substrate-binding protein [Treponema sp.]|jgi:peptide/nickel transport system substrate-binding protein|nr:ABC transporter substrate-binding protein [Treponema sp.]